MKTFIPAIVLANLFILFLVGILISPVLLPERCATSFNMAGEAEGWMSRSSYMTFIFATGLFCILIMVVIGYASRFMPDKLVNVPRREYWLAPERRAETMNYFFRQMLWYACLMAGFFLALHLSTIHANRLLPPHLPGGEFIAILAGFLGGTLVWTLLFYMHFRRPK